MRLQRLSAVEGRKCTYIYIYECIKVSEQPCREYDITYKNIILDYVSMNLVLNEIRVSKIIFGENNYLVKSLILYDNRQVKIFRLVEE